ncbi:MAG: hypothetical protein KFKLKKLM_01582 [Flavobacteriales bacterium]|nr:hypothetical protein [Flavobacteriales bacterium]
MRKIYKHSILMGLGLMLSSTNIKAQTTDFQDLILLPESYWDGSDLSGTHNNGVFTSEFISGEGTFPNVYDTTWGAPGYWLGGFAYSNITDTVTSGFGNKYSAKAGSGYQGSPNYIVGTNQSSFKLNPNGAGVVIHLTNSTYAYNSMRDGDAFAKKFGGPTGNDPDWFLLNVKGYYSGALVDMANLYLADFRFTNNSQDYILKDWSYVSLGYTDNIDSLYFELSSSDTGMFGMNTPAFFCIGQISEVITSVDELTQNTFSFFPNPANEVLNIKSENNIEQLTITDMSGRVVKTIYNSNTNQVKVDVADLISGIYFIQVVSKGVPQVQKFIKQ